MSSTSCPSCSHPFEAGPEQGNLSGDPSLTHDVTSDGKLWCSACEGECQWVVDTQERLARMLAAYSALRAGGNPVYVRVAVQNLEEAFLFATRSNP